MNDLESKYWDSIALQTVDVEKNMVIMDNNNKRRIQIAKLMPINFFGTSVLEIGIGNGVLGGVMKAIYGRKINYQATDMSKVFVEFCTKKYGIPVQQADVTTLPYPDHTFDYVFAFDSLEHVHPDDREAGNRQIDRVMKKDACIILNIPMSPSKHDQQFDHSYTYMDFIKLLHATRSSMATYNIYTVNFDNGASPIQCAWAVGERHI